MVFLVLVLTANMIASTGSGPAIINFDLFVAVFAILSLFYLIIATLNENFIFHPMLMLGLDIANTIWTFIGAVATAAMLGATSCGNGVSSRQIVPSSRLRTNPILQNYVKNNGIIRNSTKRCNESKASDVFLFLAFFAFLASTVFTGLDSRGRVNMRSNPTMSQVTV